MTNTAHVRIARKDYVPKGGGGASPPDVEAPGGYLAFDYPDALLAADSISRFEAQWDESPSWDGVLWNPQDVGVGYVDENTAAGCTTYPIPIPFTSGTHTVQIRACNATACSDPSVLIEFTVS